MCELKASKIKCLQAFGVPRQALYVPFPRNMRTLLPWLLPPTTSHKYFNFGLWWTTKHKEICHPFSLQTFLFTLLYRTLSSVWTDWSVSFRGGEKLRFSWLLISQTVRNANIPQYQQRINQMMMGVLSFCMVRALISQPLSLEILSPYISCITSP